MKSSNRLQSLQTLRAVAAIWVMITHVFQRLELQPFGYFFSGQYGVDVFFILSGFIIYLTTKNDSDWRIFARKRIFRIFPLYLTCLLIYYMYYHWQDGLSLSALGWLQNVLMIPFSDAIGYHSLVVGQAWSTCYELYFYVVMALLLLLGCHKKMALWVLGALFVVAFPLTLVHTPLTAMGIGRYATSLLGSIHIPKFLVGIAIAMLYEQQKFTPPQNVCCNKKSLLIIFLALALYLLLLLSSYNHLIAFFGATLFFCFALLINPLVEQAPDSFWKRAIVYLGDISFSIYLVHSIVIRFYIQVLGVTSFITLLFFTVTTTIILSSLSYHCIEYPFIMKGKVKTEKRQYNL